MKTPILLATLIATTATADEATEWPSYCTNLANVASTVMSARQNGVSLVDVLGTGEIKGNAKQIVITAYRRPAFGSESMKQKQVTAYRDEVYLSCYDAFVAKHGEPE